MQKNTTNSPLLGVFDSGVGGFSVYKRIREVTQANVVYYGDCARAPYGNREESEIREFVKEDIRFLQDENVTHFVNACNSMSVITTNRLLQECSVPEDRYTDMIRAFQRHASFDKEAKVLLVATHATIRSGVYQDVLHKKGVTCFEYEYIDLAGAIERNVQEEELMAIIMEGMKYAQEKKVTHIVYGCTHYPLVHDLFLIAATKVRWKGEYVDPGIYVAEEVRGWNLFGERLFTPHASKDTPAFMKAMIAFL